MEGGHSFEFYDTEIPPSDLPERALSICSEIGFQDLSGSPCTAVLEDENLFDGHPTNIYWEEPDSITNIQVLLSFREDFSEEVNSILKLRPEHLGESTDGDDDARYTGFRETFVNVVCRLAVAFDPALVTSYHSHYFTNEPSAVEVIPQETPIKLGHLPWFGIYGEELLEQFGGRERVLQTPAWRVQELETGSVLIIKTREPWGNYGRDQPADRFLRDGEDVESATTEPATTGFSDPFAALEPGEYGADVCIAPSDAPVDDECATEDLQLVRGRVDERGHLRRIEDDSYVRAVVDEPPADRGAFLDAMVTDRPAGATERLVSVLVSGDIPPSFVRLDGPDDENVVTKVMELDVETSTHDLLVSLGRVAQREDFDAADLETMEGALDTLASLDPDVEGGLEALIEECLL